MKYTKQRGAVSIFIVIFTALLVTIVTASFIQIMLRNQQQASNNDLSQSAYDSALAGVEDAKRALVRLKDCQKNTGDNCEAAIETALAGTSCEALGQTGAGIVTFNQGEVGVGVSDQNQAYTCVKVQLDTDTVEGHLTSETDTDVVPLRGVSAFNRVKVSWFTREDLPAAAGGVATFSTNPIDLSAFAAWADSKPSLLRTQLIQFSQGGLSLSNFDSPDTDHAVARFLVPDDVPGLTTTSFATDRRRAGSARNNPVITSCETTFATTTHLCSTTITLPAMANREAYLQLAAFYNPAHYKLELFNGGVPVKFSGVQPIVDATGRSSDLFRRVKARVSVSDSGSSVQFPEAALSVRGNLCKDFFITDDPDDYLSDTDSIVCDPTL